MSAVLVGALAFGAMASAWAGDRPAMTAQARSAATKRPKPKKKPAASRPAPAPATAPDTTSAPDDTTATPSSLAGTATGAAPLSPAIPGASGPAAAPPTASSVPAAPPGSPLPGAAHLPASPWISLDLGYAIGTRWFRHSEPSTGELRTYTGVRLHSIVASVVAYPFERMSIHALENLGVTLGYAQSLGVVSRLTGQSTTQTTGAASARDTGPFATTYRSWDAGLRFRFASSPDASAWRLAAGAGYRQWSYDFDLADQPQREVPRAHYPLARASFDIEKPLGPVVLGAGASYLVLLGAVTLGDRRSESFGHGVEATFAVSYSIIRKVRVRAAITYTVFRYPLAPLAGRTDQSGVVWDHYLFPLAGAELTL